MIQGIGTRVLAHGTGLFAVALLLHVAVWSVKRPRRHLLALAAVFLPFWLLDSLLIFTFRAGRPLALQDWAAISLLFAGLSAAYIQTYPVLQAMSPSLRIVLAVGKAMPRGLAEGEIVDNILDPRAQLSERIEDLLEARLLAKTAKGGLRLCAPTVAFIMPFYFLRKLLGLELGRG